MENMEGTWWTRTAGAAMVDLETRRPGCGLGWWGQMVDLEKETLRCWLWSSWWSCRVIRASMASSTDASCISAIFLSFLWQQKEVGWNVLILRTSAVTMLRAEVNRPASLLPVQVKGTQRPDISNNYSPADAAAACCAFYERLASQTMQH